MSSRDSAQSNAAVLHQVSFAYAKDPVVRDVTLTVRAGRVMALLGPNGAGKTTILKLLIGALSPTAGHVEQADGAAYVPQVTAIAFSYSVFDVVLMGRARHVGTFSVPSRQDEDIAFETLNRLGLAAFADRPFETLSGGERQLVLLARALASDARMLVLDEPTSALDLSNQHVVLERIDQLCRVDGMTIVFSTHQPELAAAVADDVALVSSDGGVVSGTTDDMMTAEHLTALFSIDVRAFTVSDGLEERRLFVPAWSSNTARR